MKKTTCALFSGILLVLLHASPVFAQQSEIDVLTDRLVNGYLKDTVNYVLLEESFRSMNADGSWSDIDYSTVTVYYAAGRHLERLVNMTLAYRKEETGHISSEELLKKIVSGIDFFYKRKPVSLNWWYMDIGAPQKYMVVLILLKGILEQEQLNYYASFLEDKTDNPAHKGKNRTWVSAITIHKGCIKNKFDLIKTGFQSIASTIKIVDYHEIEGIKIDNSIHQHRPQLYSGGYGMSFMNDLAVYIILAHGTVFSALFTEEQMNLIRNVMLDGQLLFSYRNSFDFGTIGRGISKENGLENITPAHLDLMKVIDSSFADIYEVWKNHLQGGPFPTPGNKYFWKSDIMTHHGEKYYLSAKVISARTNGTEMLNGENKQGYYLPLGATNIMTNGNEYKNIFPVWDWTRVPGTTSVSNPSAAILNWYHFGSNKYAGGVSNRKYGCIAFEHFYNGVQARKSYFFIGNAMLCLGAGITAYRTNDVVTTVNQTYSKGDVYFHLNGETRKLSEKSVTSNDISWIYHNQVAYIFPDKGKIVLNQKQQTGSWYAIRDDGSKDEQAYDIFSLWIDHGNEPQDDRYSYLVLPDINPNEMEKKAIRHGFVILKNEPDIQAVKNENRNVYAMVFYSPGSILLDKELELSVDKESVILLEKREDGFEISVADPLYQASRINIRLNKKLSGEDVRVEKSHSTIHFELPQGEYTGSTVTKVVKSI